MSLYKDGRIGRLGLTALTAMLLSSTAAVAATATTSAADSDSLKTIIVTARQRSESLENVPAQVSVITSSEIDAKGITKPADFLSSVPNVSFVQTQNAGTSFITIRGISQARNSEPSAAVVVDGVPMTNPAQFNSELLDIQQIEVLKGPQGALYGRNAIGGAILITTKKPTDHWEAEGMAGYESGPGYRFQGEASGPVTDKLKVRGAFNYFSTVGHLHNDYLNNHVDPVRDLSGRLSAFYTPTDDLTIDLNLSMDLLKTRGLYYKVPPIHEISPPLTPYVPATPIMGALYPGFNDPNNTSLPIVLDNPGKDLRHIYDGSLKVAYNKDWGTLTSITGFNAVREILTGDAYNFKPAAQSFLMYNYGSDQVQSQYLNVKTWSQEFRYTSPSDRRFRWITGTQLFFTDRYISTSTQFDVGQGAVSVYKVPAPLFAPQYSFLADSQSQFAWAAYLDTSTSLTDKVELSLNVRYDSDHRQNTTETPQVFLTYFGIPSPQGTKRSKTWDDIQPQAVLRYTPTDNINLYASYSRGFRSGGFNQTGVGLAAINAGFANVNDTFGAETADSFEVGFKSKWLDRRLLLNGSWFYTIDRNAYFFAYIATNSTQNLGNIKRVDIQGFDLDATARLTKHLTVDASFGYTHSAIKDFPGSPTVIGAWAPLVPLYNSNFAAQYLAPISPNMDVLLRVDYTRIGPEKFVIPQPDLVYPFSPEPNPIARDPVDLVNFNGGLRGPNDGWEATLWIKNLLNRKYNTEYSTGGFLFPAQPVTWGVNLKKRF